MEERASSVIRELSTEVEGLTDQLKKYKLICFYCGLRMNPDTVNLECELNRSKDAKPERRFETEKSPPEKHIGSQRHFFSKLLST